MSEIIAIDAAQVAHTLHKLTHIADGIRAKSQDLVGSVLPDSRLAAPFSNTLSRFLYDAAAAVDDVTAWAEKAQTDVRATVRDIADADAEANELAAHLGKSLCESQPFDHQGTRR